MTDKTSPDQPKQPTDAPVTRAETVDVTLDVPLTRGQQTITTVTLRRPRSGELRGITLMDLAQLDVTALQKVLPRITTPTLTKADVENLDLADLTEMGTQVSLFLARRELISGIQTA